MARGNADTPKILFNPFFLHRLIFVSHTPFHTLQNTQSPSPSLHTLFHPHIIQELRNTLEDGHAIIDIVRTLRGAECEDAKFTPPSAKPAKIEGAGVVSVCLLMCWLREGGRARPEGGEVFQC